MSETKSQIVSEYKGYLYDAATKYAGNLHQTIKFKTGEEVSLQVFLLTAMQRCIQKATEQILKESQNE